MKVSVLLMFVVMVGSLGAQETPGRSRQVQPRVVPVQRGTPGTARVRTRIPAPHQQPAEEALSENIVIRLQGSFGTGPNVDLSLGGVGPLFLADTMLPGKKDILTQRYTVKSAGDGFRVEYSVGMRVAMETSRGGNMVNIEYRDLTLTGTVLLQRGKRVVIARNGEQSLSLMIDLPKQE